MTRFAALAAASLLAASLLHSTARAEEPAPTAARIEGELHVAAEQARDTRVALGVSGLVAGAALLPAGIGVATRSGDVPRSIGTGMVTGGGVSLFFAALSLRSSKVEGLAASFDARRAAGVPEAEVIAQTESEWSSAAEDSRASRTRAGIVEIALGVAATGVGLTFLLAPAGIGGMDRNTQYTAGSIVLGPGIPLLGVGVRSLLVASPEEASWKAHQAGRPAPSRGPTASLGILPLPSGGGLAATGTF